MSRQTTGQFELLTIGSGEAGKYLAWTMASIGHRTAIVERSLIGGSCPNIACLPSKNVIHSAKVASFARRAGEYGLEGPPLTTSMEGVRRRKRQMVRSEIATARSICNAGENIKNQRKGGNKWERF